MLRDGARRKQLQTEIGHQWSQFSEEDLRNFDGDRQKLVDLLEARYGFTKRRAQTEADWFLQHFEARLLRAS